MDKRSSADIREEINFRTGKLAGEDEERMGIWGDPPQFEDAEDNLVEVDLPPDEDEGSEIDPEAELQELQSLHEEDQVAQMSPQQRSAYRKAQKEIQAQKATEFSSLFGEDAEEFAAKYRDFPEEVKEFANNFRFGWISAGLTEDQVKTCENPQEELFFKFLSDKAKQKGKIRHERLREIFQTATEGPKLRSRVRDRIFGYDKPEEKMSHERISEMADSIFEE